jgi:hypothetical protein
MPGEHQLNKSIVTNNAIVLFNLRGVFSAVLVHPLQKLSASAASHSSSVSAKMNRSSSMVCPSCAADLQNGHASFVFLIDCRYAIDWYF